MHKIKSLQTTIALLVAFSVSSCGDTPRQQLSEKSAARKQPQISVSGLSSGAYMAMQFHLSYSERVVGSGLIAGGPYFCAEGSIGNALKNCVSSPDSSIDLSVLAMSIENYQQSGKLAHPEYNTEDKVWLLHGTLDTKINRVVADQLAAQTRSIFQTDHVKYVNELAFSHVMPTVNNGTSCTESKAPFIGNCAYDAAGELLKFIAPISQTKSEQSNEELSQQLISFKQSEFAGEYASTLGEEAYLFVPNSCQDNDECDIHVSFHGCNQNAEAVGNEFAKNAGFNAWAQTNSLIVLYPQTKKSAFMPLNPQACWDWWGYTGEDYANKDGKQLQAVMTLVDNIPEIKAHVQ